MCNGGGVGAIVDDLLAKEKRNKRYVRGKSGRGLKPKSTKVEVQDGEGPCINLRLCRVNEGSGEFDRTKSRYGSTGFWGERLKYKVKK